MNEEYLWNREGNPDPETVQLETLLGPLGFEPSDIWKPKPAKRRSAMIWWLAAAAALAAGIIALQLPGPGRESSWRLDSGASLRTGQMLEVAQPNGLTIRSQVHGEVKIERGSRFRLIEDSERVQRFDLKQGTIHAFIWAPPGHFVVNTPSARTVDLGCRYKLQISEHGDGLLSVETGWVAFEWRNRESFIPAGAACATRPGTGPGTPWFIGSSETMTNALARFDASGDSGALAAVLENARERDALTLWHLLLRTEGAARGQVFDRFAALVRLSPGIEAQVTKEAILRGDPKAVDDAWNALGFGDANWWRQWKRPW